MMQRRRILVPRAAKSAAQYAWLNRGDYSSSSGGESSDGEQMGSASFLGNDNAILPFGVHFDPMELYLADHECSNGKPTDPILIVKAHESGNGQTRRAAIMFCLAGEVACAGFRNTTPSAKGPKVQSLDDIFDVSPDEEEAPDEEGAPDEEETHEETQQPRLGDWQLTCPNDSTVQLSGIVCQVADVFQRHNVLCHEEWKATVDAASHGVAVQFNALPGHFKVPNITELRQTFKDAGGSLSPHTRLVLVIFVPLDERNVQPDAAAGDVSYFLMACPKSGNFSMHELCAPMMQSAFPNVTMEVHPGPVDFVFAGNWHKTEARRILRHQIVGGSAEEVVRRHHKERTVLIETLGTHNMQTGLLPTAYYGTWPLYMGMERGPEMYTAIGTFLHLSPLSNWASFVENEQQNAAVQWVEEAFEGVFKMAMEFFPRKIREIDERAWDTDQRSSYMYMIIIEGVKSTSKWFKQHHEGKPDRLNRHLTALTGEGLPKPSEVDLPVGELAEHVAVALTFSRTNQDNAVYHASKEAEVYALPQ